MWIGTRDGLCRYDGRSFVRIDEIIPEKNLMANLKKAIVSALKELKKLSVDELLDKRYMKFTEMGRFK